MLKFCHQFCNSLLCSSRRPLQVDAPLPLLSSGGGGGCVRGGGSGCGSGGGFFTD